MKRIPIIMLLLALFGTMGLSALETSLGKFRATTGSMELSYESKGGKYKIFMADKHIVNTCLMYCRSAKLKALQNTFKKSIDKTGKLKVGQSDKMGVVKLEGGEFHFVAHNDEGLGKWVQVMVFKENGVDQISFGVFTTEKASDFYALLGKRYRRSK